MMMMMKRCGSGYTNRSKKNETGAHITSFYSYSKKFEQNTKKGGCVKLNTCLLIHVRSSKNESLFRFLSKLKLLEVPEAS